MAKEKKSTFTKIMEFIGISILGALAVIIIYLVIRALASV